MLELLRVQRKEESVQEMGAVVKKKYLSSWREEGDIAQWVKQLFTIACLFSFSLVHHSPYSQMPASVMPVS